VIYVWQQRIQKDTVMDFIHIQQRIQEVEWRS
jgi:hypothetical protein